MKSPKPRHSRSPRPFSETHPSLFKALLAYTKARSSGDSRGARRASRVVIRLAEGA